jgi:hypothetical protein
MALGLQLTSGMKFSLLTVSCFSLLVVGCQTSTPMKVSDGGSFMSLWNTYAHCQSETNLDELSQDATVLRKAASRSVTMDSFVLPLPGNIQRLVTTPSARLAVDVKAMSASCALRAGQTAIQVGKTEVARSLLESVLEYNQPDYVYYSVQAKTMLSEIDNPAVKVSLRIQ